MKKQHFFPLATVCVALTFFSIGCNSKATETTAKADVITETMVAKPDMAAVKADIQALENAWAVADNARNADAVIAFYADDAVSLSNNRPMTVGKAAIRKDYEAALAKRPKGGTITFAIMDVYGDDNMVTEVGKATTSDAAGKVITTGKYMAVWEKRDGKYVCIRDISNDDAKQK